MLLPSAIPKTRKHLSFDPLIRQIRRRAVQLPDARKRQCLSSVADAVLSAVAMFSLKNPSLLAFQERRNDENMKNLFRIQQVPSDTQMRVILDPLEPDWLRPLFNDPLGQLQRVKALEPLVFHEGCYLLSVDGTEYFSSKKVHCESCLQRKNNKTGEITYYHQMLAAVLVHPDHKQVIPFGDDRALGNGWSRSRDYQDVAASIEAATQSRQCSVHSRFGRSTF